MRSGRHRVGWARSLAAAALAVTALLVGDAAARAALVPFSGTLAIQVETLPMAAIAGSGVATVNGSGGGTHVDTLGLAGGTFAAAGAVLPVTDPGVFPILGVQLTVMNAAGSFAAGSGIMGLLGSTKICLFGPCSAAVANLYVPLAPVGVGGGAHITGSVNLTVVGAPWTTGTAAVGSITRMGFASGPGSAASSTALTSGRMQLVTPIFISTNIGSSAVVPAFGILALHFVPEPTTLALLGGGLAIVAGIGRRRLAQR